MRITMMCIAALALSFAACFAQQASPSDKIPFDDLPNVPLPQRPGMYRETATFWSIGNPDAAVPLRSNSEVWHDKTWRVAQAVWLGATIYDLELTHAGLAHHRCVEGNIELGQHPSRTTLYLTELPVYAIGTGFNWLLLKYVGKPLILEFPAYGSIQHIRGGTAWLTNCW